ncbi:MAG: hypothetical protein AAGK97_11470 [Bacteroidota bacterium]
MLKILTFIIVGYFIYRYFNNSKLIEDKEDNQGGNDDIEFTDYEEIEE